MGISLAQHRITVGLFFLKFTSSVDCLQSDLTVDNQIMFCLCIIALSLANILFKGFLCLEHILSILCYFFSLSIDVHPNPGPNTSSQNQFKFCHSNVRSIKSAGKIDEIQLLAQSENLDIITISETLLDDSYPDQLLLIDNFQPPFRRDRRTGRGGGVMTYVKSSIPCLRRLDLESNNSECIWMEASTLRGKVLIGNYYRPPGQSAEVRDAFL